MVFEDLLNKIGKRKIYSLFLGILYVLISYGTATVFFPAHISLAMIFFVTLLLIPSTAKLISIEEKFERRDGLHHFIKDHYVLIEIFLFLFIGIFIGYIIIGNYAETALTYQTGFLENQGIVGNFINQNIQKFPQLIGLLLNNLSVIVIAFLLSLFYGVGALFLIVLNASIFATFLLKFSEIAASKLSSGLLLLHFIPEVLGFLLAAIAGGVISKAIIREKPGTIQFRNVVKDGTILLLLAIVVILIAAILEAFVTPELIKLLI